MLYRPRLPNGKPAPLTWPLVVYRSTNNICWPLEDNASWSARAFDRFCFYAAFAIFVLTNDAELRYLLVNLNNVDELLTGVPTYVTLVEIHLRGFAMAWKKDNFKQLLQKFYAEVYIEKQLHPHVFKDIQRQFLPIFCVSFLYICALAIYVLIPIYLLSTGSRELLYKMIPRFDYQPLYIYLPCMLCNIWIGFIVATMMLGEANILFTLIFHLNGRYRLMKENLHDKVDQLLKSQGNNDIVLKYRRILVETINENVKLNKFAGEIQNEFSFRLFITFAFMAASICVLGFKVYTSPMTSIGYMFWAAGKVQEVIAYGQMGTSIVTITDEISSMYYESKWETIIERCEDSKENVRVMRLVNLAILTNRKPFHLSGWNFFVISLTSAVTMLQGAGSYFTCLISFR